MTQLKNSCQKQFKEPCPLQHDSRLWGTPIYQRTNTLALYSLSCNMVQTQIVNKLEMIVGTYKAFVITTHTLQRLTYVMMQDWKSE